MVLSVLILQSGGKGAVKGAAGKGAAAPKVSEADRAVLQLKMQRDKMLQGRKKVLSVMARETEIAKALLKVCPPPFRMPQPSPPWGQPTLVNSHTNATKIGWHLWEID